MDDSAITFGEVIESYDEEISFSEKKVTCKTHIFYILLKKTIAKTITISQKYRKNYNYSKNYHYSIIDNC